MDISGEYRIKAPRDQVWAALNDPDFIRRALPGCEEMEKVSDTEFNAKVKAKIGPVKSNFSSKVSLINLNPPESYTLVGEGKGGAAGFAKGSADVKLEEDGDETILRYTSDLQVGGKLAQIGNRLVGGAAQKTAEDFFKNFTALLNPAEAPPDANPEPPAVEPPPTVPAPGTGSAAPAPDNESAATTVASAPTAPPSAAPAPAATPTPAPAQPSTTPSGTTQSNAAPTTPGSNMKPVVWIVVAVIIVILLFLIF